jgi:hypothetical protein
VGTWGFRGLYATFETKFGAHVEPVGVDCWKCLLPHPDLAHTVFEYVAAVLGAELERRIWVAVGDHEAAHGCGRPGWWPSCAVSAEFLALLPEGMQPIAVAAS